MKTTTMNTTTNMTMTMNTTTVTIITMGTVMTKMNTNMKTHAELRCPSINLKRRIMEIKNISKPKSKCVLQLPPLTKQSRNKSPRQSVSSCS